MKAVGIGSATITAKALGSSAAIISDDLLVTVTAPAVPVSGITVTPKSLSIAAGGSMTLTASIAPNDASVKDVIWATSDPTIARVDDDGIVTGVSAGVADITVVSTSDPSKSDRSIVTVTSDAFIHVASITLDQTTLALESGEVGTLIAEVLPQNANDKSVRWESSQPFVAFVRQDGTISAFSAGVATITATAEGADPSAPPLKASAEVKVTGDASILAESVTVEPASLSFEKGKSATFSVTIHPENATNQLLNITSSKPSVATAHGNEITGVSAGNAIITVVALGGVNVEAKIAVTITEPYSPPPNPNPAPAPGPSPDPDPNPDPNPNPTPDPDPNPNPTPDPYPNPTPDPNPDPAPTPTPSSYESSGGGGCDAGAGAVLLLLLAGFAAVRKEK